MAPPPTGIVYKRISMMQGGEALLIMLWLVWKLVCVMPRSLQ